MKTKNYLKFILLCISFFFMTQADECSIVFVHLGSALPIFIFDALSQARLFNSDASIYLIANHDAFSKENETVLASHRIIKIACEDLVVSDSHKIFLQKTTLNNTFREGFWRKATERFFYIEELMKHYNLQHIVHLENDTMLYVNIADLLPVFKTDTSKILAVFDNDNRCIPCFLYIADHSSMTHLTHFIAEYAHLGLSDMEIIPHYKKKYGAHFVNHLPIIMPSYAQDRELTSTLGYRASDPSVYSYRFNEFESIFDGAALGQYLGGIDPRNGPSLPGFINESSVFNSSHFSYEWVHDTSNRKVPYMVYKGQKFRINNLHIHSKNLKAFRSDIS